MKELVVISGKGGTGKTSILALAIQTETNHDIVITQSDISHLIRSKGAVFAAIKSLMDYVGLR